MIFDSIWHNDVKPFFEGLDVRRIGIIRYNTQDIESRYKIWYNDLKRQEWSKFSVPVWQILPKMFSNKNK